MTEPINPAKLLDRMNVVWDDAQIDTEVRRSQDPIWQYTINERQMLATLVDRRARIKILELERDTVQQYADQVGANLTAAEGTLAERDARIAELEQIMTLHFITLDDDHRPEGKQGWEKERAFRDECCRIIQRQAKEASRGRE